MRRSFGFSASACSPSVPGLGGTDLILISRSQLGAFPLAAFFLSILSQIEENARLRRSSPSSPPSPKASLKPLIPPCVLSDDSKMGEIRHRADMLWIGLKLHQSITEDLNDLIEGFRIPICKVLFA